MNIKLLFIISTIFFSCSNVKEQLEKNDLIEKTENVKELEIIQESLELSDEELIAKWTWNESITTPSKSNIQNCLFESRHLLQQWCFPNENKPIFEFTKDYFNEIHNKYIYTLQSDSLRIFTLSDQLKNGVDRGIISKLTSDSLIIEWSTGDSNKYVAFHKKDKTTLSEAEAYELIQFYTEKISFENRTVFLNSRQIKAPKYEHTLTDTLLLFQETISQTPPFIDSYWNTKRISNVKIVNWDFFQSFLEIENHKLRKQKWIKEFGYEAVHNISYPIYNKETNRAVILDDSFSLSKNCGTGMVKIHTFKKETTGWKLI